MFRWSVLIVTFLLLIACQSQKEYRYLPPVNKNDRLCASHCSAARRSCEKLCRLKNPACFARQEMLYGEGQIPRNSSCYSACHCTISYNTCYRACGGQVFDKLPTYSY